jgi:hypothetical protein
MERYAVGFKFLTLFSIFTLAQLFLPEALMAAQKCESMFSKENTALVIYDSSGSQQMTLGSPHLIEIRDPETKAHDNLDMFAAGNDTLVTKQVKYVTNGRSGLAVEEHLLSPTEIISLENQKRLFSSYEVLNEVSDLIQKKFYDKLEYINMEFPMIVGSHVVFTADTKGGQRLYLKYDYKNKIMSLISSTRIDTESSSLPVMKSLNSKRFVLVETRGTRRSPNVYEIIDIETNKKFAFNFIDSHMAYIKLSEDGDSFSVTYHNFEEKTQENRIYAIKKSQWKKTGAPQNLSDFKLLNQFQGKMLGADKKLQIFVVDESRNIRALEPVMLDFSQKKIRRVLLSGWPQMRAKLQQAAEGGLNLDFTEAQSELSGNGNYFSMRIRLYHGEVRTALVKDLFLLWNLQFDAPPRVVTSENLDSAMSSEPNAKNYTKSLKGLAWARQIESRLLDDGTLLIARSLIQSNQKDITVDVVRVRDNSPSLPVQTGVLTELNLDPYSQKDHWKGVTHLQISPDGNSVALDITGVGIRLMRIQ